MRPLRISSALGPGSLLAAALALLWVASASPGLPVYVAVVAFVAVVVVTGASLVAGSARYTLRRDPGRDSW